MPVETGTSTAGRAFTHGAIDIPANLQPGDYMLRVEVEDRLPRPDHAMAWRWARLSVVSVFRPSRPCIGLSFVSGWTPDLRKYENRFTIAVLVKI